MVYFCFIDYKKQQTYILHYYIVIIIIFFRIKMAAKTLLLNVSGMTCGKCEKIIREGIMEDVKEVKNVEVDRPESKVTVEFQTDIAEQFDEKKEQILSIVNSLVNGKFTATVVDSGVTEWKKNLNKKRFFPMWIWSL